MEERKGASAEELRYNRSTNGGCTFAAADQLIGAYTSGTDDVDNVDMAISGSTVIVAWEDNRTSADEIYQIGSFDNGATWSADHWVTDPANGYAGGYPKVDIDGRLSPNGDVADRWAAQHPD